MPTTTKMKPHPYKLKVSDEDLFFDVFKQEARKNRKEIKQERAAARAKEILPKFLQSEAVQAACAGLTKKQRKAYLNLLVHREQISKGQRKRVNRNLDSNRTVAGQRTQQSRRKRVPRKYAAYIKSDHWVRRRNRYWQIHKRQCAACHGAKQVQLHHMVYEPNRYGDEPDAHLIGLCDKHHQQYHAENGTQKNMLKKTTAFVLRELGELAAA